MFLALCWLFALLINVISSVLVQAVEHDVIDCHPWSFYNDTLHHCQCYESLPGYTLRPYKQTECSERKTSIYIGHCMTTEELGTFINKCAAYSPKVNITLVNGMYIQLPESSMTWLSDKGNIEGDRARVDYMIFCVATRPWTGLVSRNLKPRKLILRAFSDFPRNLAPPKITRHTVAIPFIFQNC
jgi:hypothetical protein